MEVHDEQAADVGQVSTIEAKLNLFGTAHYTTITTTYKIPT